jgi:toxin-antitoxin system PIN domain toxin
MKIVDTNILLYAVNEDSQAHVACREWLQTALAGNEAIGLPWLNLLAFVRVSTNPRVFPRPLTVSEAMGYVQGWLAAPCTVTPEPTPRHAQVLAGLLNTSGTAANLTNDAYLAALALQADADVVTMDRDFLRFGVRIVVPGAP